MASVHISYLLISPWDKNLGQAKLKIVKQANAEKEIIRCLSCNWIGPNAKKHNEFFTPCPSCGAAYACYYSELNSNNR